MGNFVKKIKESYVLTLFENLPSCKVPVIRNNCGIIASRNYSSDFSFRISGWSHVIARMEVWSWGKNGTGEGT
jgi:hypothetical protein